MAVEFPFDAGRLALSFVNAEREAGMVPDFEALVEWGAQGKVYDAGTAAALRAAARDREGEVARVLARGSRLSGAIFELGVAASEGREPAAQAVAALNTEVKRANRFRELVRRGSGLAWEWAAGDELDRPLWAVAIDAAELFLGDDASRIRVCGSDTCNWLFVDTSRNRSRRWCDMAVCGNRAKARRYYARTKTP